MKGHRCREAVSWVDSHSGFKDLINVFAKYNRRFKKKQKKTSSKNKTFPDNNARILMQFVCIVGFDWLPFSVKLSQ